MASQSRYRKTVFKNGLTLLTEQVQGFRSLSIGIWVRIGTRHEVKQVAGVSHFLEHMLFKGTTHRSALQIAREVDQVGGEFNAFTSREHTCFHLLLLDKDYRLGLDILSDVLLNSQFKSEELEREREVILQEVSMVEESPEELAYDLYFEQIYGKHGLGKPILGTTKSIRKLNRKEIVGFFRDHYRPRDLILAVSGNVSHEVIQKEIGTLVKEKWPGRPVRKKRALDLITAPPLRSGFWWADRPTEQVHLIWGVPGPTYTAKDRFAAFLLNVYLGGGMSSLLFQEIREKKGLAYTVYSSLSPATDSGVFNIYCATHPSKVRLCLDLIDACVNRVRSKELPLSELKLLQENLKGTLLLSADSVESRMFRIAQNELFLGKHVSTEEACRLIDQVKPSDLQRLAQDLFKEDRVSILALGPRPKSILGFSSSKRGRPQLLPHQK